MPSFIAAFCRRKIFSSNLKRRETLLKACHPGIEALEARQLLSITANTLAGGELLNGATSSDENLGSGGTVLATTNYTLIGRNSNFTGTSAIETDSNASLGGGAITTTEKSYSDITSAGFVEYGYTSIGSEEGTQTSTGTTTYSPAEVILPPTLVAGMPYVEKTNQIVVTTPVGASSTTMVTQISSTLTLESATMSVTVPAGTYTADVIDDSTTTTPTTGSPNTFTDKQYWVPNVGLVDDVFSSASVELTAFKAGSGGGGGTGVTPTITRDTVPTAIIGGAKLHAALKVDVANSGTATEDGFTANVYASTTPNLDTSTATLVTSVTSHASIKGGKSKSLSIPIKRLPSGLPDGTYYLIVETKDSAGNTENAATSSTVTVAAPFVALSETLSTTLPAALVSGTAAKGNVILEITNNGNVESKGSTGIDITASTASGTLGTTILDNSKTVNIAPGKTAKVTESIKSIPALANNHYFLVTQVTDPFAAGTSIVSSASTIDIAAPFITLLANLGMVVKVDSGDTLTITNNGNIEDSTKFMAVLGFSTDNAGMDPIGTTTTITTPKLTIKPGASAKVKLTGWKSILSGLATGAPYFLTAAITDETSNSALAVSSSSFMLT